MPQTIKVSMLIHDYYPVLGGAQGQLKKLIPLLTSHGIDINVITRHVKGCPPKEIIDDIPVYRMPVYSSKVSTSLSYTLNSLRHLWAFKPDIIHAYELFSPATTAAIAKIILRCPIIVKILRGGTLGDIERMHQKFGGPSRLFFFKHQFDRFVSISHEIDEELQELGINENRCVFIPNGVDTDYFKPVEPSYKQVLRRKLNLPDGNLVIFTGRLSKEKGLHTLLEVWHSIDHQNSSLIIVGSGNEETQLRQMAHHSVHFTGQVDDVLMYLQASDLFVLPSHAEGLSNAMLEAMSVGLPVITTRLGGAPDIITSSDKGWLYDVDDRKSLTDMLSNLLEQGDTLKQVGLNGREEIIKNYSLTTTAQRLSTLYRGLSRK